MKILYGVQTTGNGHLVRAKNLIDKLRLSGHEVHTLFSGDPDKEIPDIRFFRPYTFKRGLTFRTKAGKLRYLATAKQLNFYRFYNDILSFDADGFDLVITDYEPLTARIAKYNKIPSIGIGHLYSFCYSVPIHGRKTSPSLAVMNNFAPVDIPIGLHWHHFDQPILPPMIPEEADKKPSLQKDKILAYLHFEDLEEVKNFLSRYPKKIFHIYVPVEKGYDQGNLKIRPLNRENFLNDLAECEGVICNAGFSLLSEALHLGKKILAKPVEGQIEQESNALALKKLGLGDVMPTLNTPQLQEWMERSAPKSQTYPDVAKGFIQWIDRGEWNNTEGLTRQLWDR